MSKQTVIRTASIFFAFMQKTISLKRVWAVLSRRYGTALSTNLTEASRTHGIEGLKCSPENQRCFQPVLGHRWWRKANEQLEHRSMDIEKRKKLCAIFSLLASDRLASLAVQVFQEHERKTVPRPDLQCRCACAPGNHQHTLHEKLCDGNYFCLHNFHLRASNDSY